MGDAAPRPMSESAPQLYRWHWRARLPERRGQTFVVVCRGKLNAMLIRFADGGMAVTSRNALRRAA